jgi:hypothetical protein
MPLLDHFHPPLSVQRPWEGVYATWATGMAAWLNDDRLPADYFAMPLIVIEDEVLDLGAYEVQLLQQPGVPKLRAAIELVSPANKDRSGDRQAFAVKCAAYLQRGVSVVIVDIVTERTANLHAELARVLGREDSLGWPHASELYAVAYRSVRDSGAGRIDAWPEPLAVGRELPTLPLWLEDELCVPLRLEESYRATCTSLRIRV